MLERYFGYKPPIPENLQRQYEAALEQVLRWKNGNWADNIYETDMDHVARMFSVLSDIKKHSPALSSDVEIPLVEHIIYIHYAGEILVGDLTHNRDDYDLLHDRWKKREHAAFRLLTSKMEDQDLKHKARELYKRYLVQDLNDKEALLARIIDVDQGLRFGFVHVFDGRRGKGMTKAKREIQFNHAIALLSQPTKPLLKLVSPGTQEGLKSFLRDELGRFSQYGYRREVAPYTRNLDTILQ